jgi:hypothetical protein
VFVLKVATPDPFSVPVPSVVVPSLKVTASPLPELMGLPLLLTVAVNVTDCLKSDGFADAATAVVVVAWFTVWVRVEEVLPLKLPSPL